MANLLPVKNKDAAELYQQIFDAIPIGLILINQNKHICAWNAWMASSTAISAEKALGQTIESLFPTATNQRFNWALEQTLSYGHPQVLSTILNQFVIPIPLNKFAYPDLEMMQQSVQILSVCYLDTLMALVVIQDVSSKTHLQNTLLSMAVKFENSSFVDVLTGLYNRRFLWKYLDNELQNAIRENYSIACCLFDLDYFKRINDEFGHSAGDNVLISFAKLVTANIRPTDYLFRYGGEEFVVIYSQISLKEAVSLSNRLRKKLEAMTVHGATHEKITCSGGIAYWQPGDKPISAEKLVDKADMELYRAKKMGRNCIVIDGKSV